MPVAAPPAQELQVARETAERRRDRLVHQPPIATIDAPVEHRIALLGATAGVLPECCLRGIDQQHRPRVAHVVLAMQEQRLRDADPGSAQRHFGQQYAIRAAIDVVQPGADQGKPTIKSEEILALMAGVDQAREPTRPRAGASQGELIGENAMRLSEGIDFAYAHRAEHGARICLQSRHRQLEIARCQQVVMRGPFEIGAAREKEAPVVIGAGAEIARVADIPHPIVQGCKTFADFLGCVAGAIIADDQFEVAQGLREDRADRVGHVGLAVEHGQANTDQRRWQFQNLFGTMHSLRPATKRCQLR